MIEESNPIKDYLFDYIKDSKTIPKLIAEKKFDQIINDVTDNCYDKIQGMGEKEESVGTMATALLHYLLTNALITTQRKVKFKENELDIVVPDTKTLDADPKKTLLICIPKSSDIKIINEKIKSLEKIQPIPENIWLVLSKKVETTKKSFVLNKEDNTFSKIIFDIAKFSNVGESNKFKILRI